MYHYTTVTHHSEVQPSFVLMDVQGPKITMYVYRIIDDELKVQRIEHTK